jgi:hypothetical protein
MISKIEEYQLNKKILTLSLLIILTTMCITGISVSTVKAQSAGSTSLVGGNGSFITSYTIKDLTTGDTLISQNYVTGTSSSPGYVSEGEEIACTATITITVNNPSTELTLGTGMQHASSEPNMYWQEVLPSTYSLGSFNPNSQSFSFPEAAGTFSITCFGSTPTGVVEQTAANGITLNIPSPANMILLTDPTGAVLDEVKPDVINAAIFDYLGLLSSQNSALKSLKSSGVDPGYISLYTEVINASQALEEQGFTTGATTLLKDLSSTSAPPSATAQALFIPIAVVLAVIAALFGFLFMRVRGRISYLQLVVEDQIKDLEGLTMRASKIDRTLSSNLDSVKERLKRLVGM